jgi:hypothetical protein
MCYITHIYIRHPPHTPPCTASVHLTASPPVREGTSVEETKIVRDKHQKVYPYHGKDCLARAFSDLADDTRGFLFLPLTRCARSNELQYPFVYVSRSRISISRSTSQPWEDVASSALRNVVVQAIRREVGSSRGRERAAASWIGMECEMLCRVLVFADTDVDIVRHPSSSSCSHEGIASTRLSRYQLPMDSPAGLPASSQGRHPSRPLP